jgi:hypothetical protein
MGALGCGLVALTSSLIAPGNAFGAGSGYTPAGTPAVGGTATGLAGTVASTSTIQPSGGTATATVGSATIVATVPAGAFTGSVQLVETDATSSAVTPPGGGTPVVTFGIGIFANGVKVTGSFPAITVTVTSPSIVAGSLVYLVTAGGLQAVSGASVSAGSATFSITSDPVIELATPVSAAGTASVTPITGATSVQTGKPFLLEGGVAAVLCLAGALLLVAAHRRRRLS